MRYIHFAPSSGMDMGGSTRAAGNTKEMLDDQYVRKRP
jgi:hypothetical protein